MSERNRREFLKSIGAAAGAGAVVPAWLARPSSARPSESGPWIRTAGAGLPVAISSANGLSAVNRAMEELRATGDTLEAVVSGVNIVEADPDDMTVGYGGLPNHDGVVQLDSQVWHGPTRGAGAVAALEGYMHPSRVAVAVMRYTDHVLLVGPGAASFAREMGFEEADLLTADSRATFLRWRATLSDHEAGAVGKEPTALGGEPLHRGLCLKARLRLAHPREGRTRSEDRLPL